MRIIFTSVKTPAQAKKLADALVSRRLAACVSFWKINSVYRWNGKIVRAGECLLECKCAGSKERATMAFIEKNHPYGLPMLYSIRPSSTLKKYSNWLGFE